MKIRYHLHLRDDTLSFMLPSMEMVPVDDPRFFRCCMLQKRHVVNFLKSKSFV